MNMRADFEATRFDPVRPGEAEAVPAERSAENARESRLARALRGGALADVRRLPRYALFGLVGLLAVWAPVAAYLAFAPERFTSEMSLILPGAGSDSSVNLSEIGQASSRAASPYSSSAMSPTVTYKNLLGGERVLAAAAERLGVERHALGQPRVKLLDQTSFIAVQTTADSPEDAQARGEAVLEAFLEELEALRADERIRRDSAARRAIDEYRRAVAETRAEITRLQVASGLVSMDQYDAIVAEAESLASEAGEVNAALEDARASVLAMAATLGIDARLAALTLKLHADAEFQSLSASAAAHAADLAAARGRYGEKHPVLVEAREALAGAQARLASRAAAVTGLSSERLARDVDMTPNGERAALLAELVRAAAERDGLASRLLVLLDRRDAARARMERLVEAASRLDDLERDYQVAEAVFASALARSDTSKSDMFASYPLVQVVEPPSRPDAPSSPKRLLALAAGVAASLLLLGGLALGWVRRPLIDRLLSAKTSA